MSLQELDELHAAHFCHGFVAEGNLLALKLVKEPEVKPGGILIMSTLLYWTAQVYR